MGLPGAVTSLITSHSSVCLSAASTVIADGASPVQAITSRIALPLASPSTSHVAGPAASGSICGEAVMALSHTAGGIPVVPGQLKAPDR